METALAVRNKAWLTGKRVRGHALLLAVCLWSIYAWDFSTAGLRDRSGALKGTDFLYFYTIGSLALEHQGSDLYDIQAQAARAHRLVSESAGVSYLPLYGPQVSLFFAPLAKLPYGWALTAWLLLNVLIYALCCYAVWRACPHLWSDASTVLILAIAYPAFFHLIAWGQTGGLALACFTLALLALQLGRNFLAGLAIGLLIFKPQLGIAAGVVFVLAQEWGVVLGAIASASLELAIGWLYYGGAVMCDYFLHLENVRAVLPLLEPKPYQMHSLRSFWSMVVPSPGFAFGLYVVSSVLALVVTLQLWRSRMSLGLRYSGLLLATVLVSPHLTVYDLVILAPALLLLGDWVVSHPEARLSGAMRLLLYLGYALPLTGPVTRRTHLQLSVLAFSGLLWLTWQIGREPALGENREAEFAGQEQLPS